MVGARPGIPHKYEQNEVLCFHRRLLLEAQRPGPDSSLPTSWVRNRANPEGILRQSPGLRATSYPGSTESRRISGLSLRAPGPVVQKDQLLLTRFSQQGDWPVGKEREQFFVSDEFHRGILDR